MRCIRRQLYALRSAAAALPLLLSLLLPTLSLLRRAVRSLLSPPPQPPPQLQQLLLLLRAPIAGLCRRSHPPPSRPSTLFAVDACFIVLLTLSDFIRHMLPAAPFTHSPRSHRLTPGRRRRDDSSAEAMKRASGRGRHCCCLCWLKFVFRDATFKYLFPSRRLHSLTSCLLT